ncbi:transcriptional regulator (plasmid) [Cupriavidus necator N-1]|uniref:Transcriptional regulator n=1 Tax=Cupriavidus necator (strain ATCC 43291 / DSM 13513 / CCUG 52238 / LMG 8453 / N-1) TaxID=1042878 RepID=F8GYV0_CUPNN|nr:AraC family transcriptional regulator [Cupriavidus necator]AEI83041.1 transcriptional regulator [Cupriavidus necator N-1]MDX6008455.1 AraC family transcriptional regulator [Cupriavidus necator]
MAERLPAQILQGDFGRATINTTEQAIVEHAHREFNVIIKLSGADTALQLESASLEVDDSSVVLLNPWVLHAKRPSDCGPTTILSLFLNPSWLANEFKDAAPHLDYLFPRPREPIADELREKVNLLVAAITTRSLGSPGTCEERLKAVVGTVVRQYGNLDADGRALRNTRPTDHRIRKAIAYIHEHATENPQVSEITRSAGISRSHFFAQFSLCVGVPPRHYIDSLRLGIATRWLATTDRPLVDLADELGFGTHSNFTRFFTKHMALSPSEFRRRTTDIAFLEPR